LKMGRVTPLYTSRKVLYITYRTPLETLLETPETLPTSEPDTPQISYTVTEDLLPTLSMQPYSKKWVACLYGAGRFTTAGTVYWRMKRNGASVASSSKSVSANYYYTVCAHFHNVNVGDVLELALWSSVSDSNWDYKALQIQVTRLIPFNKPRLFYKCSFSLSSQPVLTLGNPSAAGTASFYPYHDDKVLPSITTDTTYTFLYAGSTYGLFRIGRGDYSLANNADVSTHSSYRPYYLRNLVPAQIIFRGLRDGGQL